MQKKIKFSGIVFLVFLAFAVTTLVFLGIIQGICQTRVTVGGEPIPELQTEWEVVFTNEEIKMNGLTWDGESFWTIIYQSSPIVWQIAKLDRFGRIVFAFSIPCKSRDDIHNSGFTNLTWDGEFIWANNWNEGKIYCYTPSGELVKSFDIPSLGQLIPVGIAWTGESLWILHWSKRTLYEVSRDGKETGRNVSLATFRPSLDMGLAWDNGSFWVGSKGANLAVKVSILGEPQGFIRGPKTSGALRDLAHDGKYLYWIYQQGHTIYRTQITE